MSWLAVLLAIPMCGGPAPRDHVVPTYQLHRRVDQLCRKHRRRECKTQRQRRRPVCRRPRPTPRPRRPPPVATPPSTPPGAAPAPAPTPTPTPTPTPAPLPSRTGVDLGEYWLVPAYRTLAAGPVELNATNFGMDDHNLTVDSAAGSRLGQVDLAPAGGTGTLTLNLSAGQYELYCSLFDHDALGMNATLTVR
jgi:plastocyanin